VAWMIGLSSVFGSAAAYPQQSPKSQPYAPLAVATFAQTPAEEKRVDFQPGVEEDLRAIAAKSIWRLAIRGEFSLVKQIWGMEDVLYYGLPIPVWNRIVTSLNDPTDRKTIVAALDQIVTDAISSNKKVAQKARKSINGWEKDPLSFAKFLGDSVGKDFVNAPQTQQFQIRPQQK
ncbi:MAG: hypothetical protein K8R48_09460, partial [Alphaproteobacteria bacterium]|nr:hypothetical protein [Alphaproteobacteria bacterium]